MEKTFKMISDGAREKGCCGQIEVPTPAEQEALAALRTIKERVRAMKDRTAFLKSEDPAGHAEELASLRETLDRLRKDWDHWEHKRKAAAKERMILLGHEKP